jgi:hypothetical protein
MTAEIEALKSLGPFVIVQAAFAALIIGAGIWAIIRGNSEKKTGPVPNGKSDGWNQYTINTVLQVQREIQEQNRSQERLLGSIEAVLKDIQDMFRSYSRFQYETANVIRNIEEAAKENQKQIREQTMLLEGLWNNQVLRGDGSVGLPPRRK